MYTAQDFQSWQEAFSALAGQLDNLRPLAASGTRIAVSGNGSRIYQAAAPVAAGNGYTGYFKVFENGIHPTLELPQVRIGDGAPQRDRQAEMPQSAGLAVINDSQLEVPAMDLPLNLERGLIWAAFALGNTGAIQFAGYGSGEQLPPNQDDTIHFLLATFEFFKGRLFLIQQHTGMLYGWIFKECVITPDADAEPSV